MHLSMSSDGIRWLGLPAYAAFLGAIIVEKTWDTVTGISYMQALLQTVWIAPEHVVRNTCHAEGPAQISHTSTTDPND